MRMKTATYCIGFILIVSVIHIESSKERLKLSNTISMRSRQRVYESDQGKVKLREMRRNSVKRLLKLGSDEDVIEKESVPTVKGTRRVRLRQTYQSIPVFGSSVSLELDWHGKPTGNAHGHLFRRIRKEISSTDPSLSKQDAIISLMAIYHPHGLNHTYVEKTRADLIITQVDGYAHLAFHTSYFVVPHDGTVASYPHGIVEARDGKVLRHWQGLTNYQIAGITGNQASSKIRYEEMDAFRDGDSCYYYSEQVEVQDLQQMYYDKDFLVRGFPCNVSMDPKYDFVNGGYSASNDVFINSQHVHHVWMNYLGRPPLGDQNQQVKIYARVHVGLCYENAYWDGSTINFGDGCQRLYPLSSIDVVAHEIAHGFTSYTSGLVYSQESGAINEAFSDMAGETVEEHVRSIQGMSNDWKIGTDIVRSPHQMLRDMREPTLPSIGHYSQYRDNMDVHHSSGIYNKAFYILSNTANWNISKAFRVMGRANQVGWEEMSTMHCGACEVETAADDLGYNPFDVQAAFEKVGIFCEKCL